MVALPRPLPKRIANQEELFYRQRCVRSPLSLGGELTSPILNPERGRDLMRAEKKKTSAKKKEPFSPFEEGPAARPSTTKERRTLGGKEKGDTKTGQDQRG